MSAPHASGFCRYGVANVLSTTHEGATLVGEGGDGLDVDAREQRVGRRLQPHHRACRSASRRRGADVGEVGRRCPGARPGRARGRSAGTCRRRRRCRARPAAPGSSEAQHGVLARPARRRRRSRGAAPSSDAHDRSRARLASGCRCGSTRSPWCSPTASWANVVDSVIGTTTAPLAASGAWPAWMARVAKPRPCSASSRSAIAAARTTGTASTSERVSTLSGRPPDSTSRAGAWSSISTAQRQRLARCRWWAASGPSPSRRASPSRPGRGRRRPSAPARRRRPTPRRPRTAARSCTPGAGTRRGGASG